MLRALVSLQGWCLGPAPPTAFAPSYYLTPELVLALIAGDVIGSMPVGLAFRTLARSAASTPAGSSI